MYRCAAHIDELAKTRVRAKIATILRARMLPVPNGTMNMVLPFLSNSNFKQQIEHWIKDLIIKFQESCVPFHLPAFKVLESRQNSLGDKIFNWKSWYTTFTFEAPDQCQCKEFILQHPGVSCQHGHVASSAALCFSDNMQLQKILRGSSKNTLYAAKNVWLAKTMVMFKRWAKHHGLPNTTWANWDEIARAQWHKHKHNMCDNPNMLAFKHVQRINKSLSIMVIHNEDHEATQFMVYCPMLYYNLVAATFGDSSVFKKHTISPADLHDKLQSMVPRKPYTKYKWGFKWDNPLPYSYIFPKSKKLFTTARPVISFCNSPFSKIFHAMSICLYAITRLAYPDNLHMDDVHQTFRKLHRFLQGRSHAKEWVFHNDDLIGFYTSVPQERILKAIRHLLSTYLAVHPPTKNKIMFTVDLVQTQSNQRVFRGKNKETCKEHLQH